MPVLVNNRRELFAQLLIQGFTAVDARANITVESLVEMQRKFVDRAYSSNQCAAGNGAVKNLAILSGKWVERTEVGGPGEFDHLSDDELKREVVELFVERSFGSSTDRSRWMAGRSRFSAMMSDPN